MSNTITDLLRIAPTHYITGENALSDTGIFTKHYGKHAFILHGATGYHYISKPVLDSLRKANIQITTRQHHGYCTHAAVTTHLTALQATKADIVIGIGGGRVLDTAKAVADAASIPYMTLPTSAATCAATTPLVVYYDQNGVYQGGHLTRENPVATIVDTPTIIRAPDRLLIAGLIDALAKVHEVQFATRHHPLTATTNAALSLSASLKTLIESYTKKGIGATPHLQTRKLLAETAILWPGLIGNLAGERSKLAAAHAIHNALTLLPGSKQSLHGELIAYGILVQQSLSGDTTDSISASARFFISLGCPCDLTSLGCHAFFTNKRPITERAVSLPSMQRCFPEIHADALADTMSSVHALAINAAP